MGLVHQASFPPRHSISLRASLRTGLLLHFKEGMASFFVHAAVAGDVLEVAALLDAHPALLDAQVGFEEQSALLKASDAGAREVVTFLLAAGASPNLQDYLGRNALYLAAVRGHEDVVDLLLQHGADPSNARNTFRSNALMAAATNGSLGVVRLLLRHRGGKGLVDEVDDDNKTAIWWACLRGHAEVVRLLLLEGGAKHDVADMCRRIRRTPKQIAETMGHMACVRVIEWFEYELDRPRSLHKARFVYEQADTPISATQVRLGPVEASDLAAPHVSQSRAVMVSETERVDTVRYVVTELSTELYRELLDGLMLREPQMFG